MLTIYGIFRSRASRNYWLCYELGIPFKQVPVVQHYRLKEPILAGTVHTKSPEFLAVNPHGHIPSMNDDGVILHESLAINLYLAKKHGGPLAPANVAEDGEMTMWSMWALVERPGTPAFIANGGFESTTLLVAQGGPKPELVEALKGPFAQLDSALAKTGWLVGGRFTVADINVAEIVRYAAGAKALFDANPNVKKWYEACTGRPAYRKMWDTREREPT
jgi:glutathione S-transferase